MSGHGHEPLTPEEREFAQRLSRLDASAAPSPALDASVLAMARAAGDGGTSAPAPAPAPAPAIGRRRRRWPLGMGIAASLVVAVGIAWQLRPQPDTATLALPQETVSAAAVARQVADDSVDMAPDDATAARGRALTDPGAAEPASAPALPSAATPQRQPEPTVAQPRRGAAPPQPPIADTDPAPAPARAAAAADAGLAARSESVRQDAPALRAAPPRPAAPTLILDDAAPAASATDAAAAAASAQVPAPPATSPPRPAARRAPTPEAVDVLADQPLDEQPPASVDSPAVRERWLQRIRELREAGQDEAARASLLEFTRRHPQADVPADLRPLLGR